MSHSPDRTTDRPRFAKGELSYNDKNEDLKRLVQAYLTTFNNLGLETWLMHDALLGWWWGGHVGTLSIRRPHASQELTLRW